MANHAAQFRALEPGKAVVKRDRTSIHFDVGNGQARAYFAIDPLHYGANNEQEIDTTWQPDTGAWQWKLVENDFQIHARSTLNAGDIVEWRDTRSDQYVLLQPLALNWVDNVTQSRQQITQPQAVTATADDCSLTWTNGYGTGRHFKYTAHPKRLVKELIIDAAANLPAPTVNNPYLEIEFILSRSSGVTLYVDGQAWDNSTRKTTANAIEFRLSNGTVAWKFDYPIATDANGDVCPGVFELTRRGAARYCTVRVPKTWVDAAVFPIKLDPTFTDGYGGDVSTAKDDAVRSDRSTRNYGVGTTVSILTTWKGLLGFNLSSIAATATCSSATLSLYHVDTGTSNAFTLTAYSIASGNGDWTEGTKSDATAGTGDPCWDYKAYNTTAWAGSAGLSTSTTDYESSSIGSASGNRADAAGTEYAFTLTTSRIAGWFGASNTNYGVLIVTSASGGSYGTSDNATTGYRPVLVVEYSAATNLTVADASVTSQVDAVVVEQVSSATTLTVNDASVTTQADAVSTSKSDTLIVADASCTTQADAVSTTKSDTLIVADASCTSQADALDLSGAATLMVLSAYVATQTDAVTLAQVHNLTVADASCSTQSDALTLTQVHNLAVADASVTTQADALTLTQVQNLAVADASVTTQADAVTLTGAATLSIADAYVGTVADAVTLLLGVERGSVLLSESTLYGAVLAESALYGSSLAESAHGLTVTETQSAARLAEAAHGAVLAEEE